MSDACSSCGLTTDDAGNLIVAVSGADGDNTNFPTTATCTTVDGTHVYCDPTTGEIFGEPEKFFRMRRFGKALSPNKDTNVSKFLRSQPGGWNYPNDTNIGTPAVVSFTNPSPCRPMTFLVEAGVSHVQMNSDAPLGAFEAEFGAKLTITGAVAVPQTDMGHQLWANYNRTPPGGFSIDVNVVFDSMGARSFLQNALIIPPGGTITMSLQGYINLSLGSTTSNLRAFTIDLVYTAWTD